MVAECAHLDAHQPLRLDHRNFVEEARQRRRRAEVVTSGERQRRRCRRSCCQRAQMFHAPPRAELANGSRLPCQSETFRSWIVTGGGSLGPPAFVLPVAAPLSAPIARATPRSPLRQWRTSSFGYLSPLFVCPSLEPPRRGGSGARLPPPSVTSGLSAELVHVRADQLPAWPARCRAPPRSLPRRACR